MTDGTTNQMDTSGKQKLTAIPDTSDGVQGTSGDKTYTELEVKKMMSDKLAQVGREAKTLETQKAELEQREGELAQWRREKDEAEYEAARGDPDALNIYQRKKDMEKRENALSKREIAVEREKLEHQIEIESAREYVKEKVIFDIAEKYGVDADVLNDLDLPPDKLEKVAAKMTNTELTGIDRATTAPKTKRDSGMTIGGRTSFSREQIRNHEFFIANKEAILEAQRLGRITN